MNLIEALEDARLMGLSRNGGFSEFALVGKDYTIGLTMDPDRAMSAFAAQTGKQVVGVPPGKWFDFIRRDRMAESVELEKVGTKLCMRQVFGGSEPFAEVVVGTNSADIFRQVWVHFYQEMSAS